MSQSFLSKTLTVSLVLHAGILGLLALESARLPLVADHPLRVRILTPPAPERQVPAPAPAPPVEARQQAPEKPAAPPRKEVAPPQQPPAPILTERMAPRPIPPPDKPPVREEPITPPGKPPVAEKAPPHEEAFTPPGRPPAAEKAPPGEKPASAGASPQVATNTRPEPPGPRQERIGEQPPQTPSPAASERKWFSFRSPLPEGSASPGTGGARPGEPARPSLREQIASIGSGAIPDEGPAKRTIDLDSQDPESGEYTHWVARRIYRYWRGDEFVRRGISGVPVILFTIDKAGTLTHIEVLNSSGFPDLDNYALRAIKLAAPYDPFPRKMTDESVNFRANFYYEMTPYYRR